MFVNFKQSAELVVRMLLGLTTYQRLSLPASTLRALKQSYLQVVIVFM